MIGFLIGSACLLGLIATVKRARYARAMGCGGMGYGGMGYGGMGYGACGAGGGWSDGYRAGPRHGGYGPPWRSAWPGAGHGWGAAKSRWVLRALFERLETTPGQERVILAAVDELHAVGVKARAQRHELRKEMAAAVRAPSFDENTVGAVTARLEGLMHDARTAGIAAFAKVHEALDERQRAMLATWLERGAGGLEEFFFWARDSRGHEPGGHPYRGAYRGGGRDGQADGHGGSSQSPQGDGGEHV